MHPFDLMMGYPAFSAHEGILFPTSYLESRIFLICLTFVAVNTLIYLGLTLVKLLPRPKPQFLTPPKDPRRRRRRKFF